MRIYRNQCKVERNYNTCCLHYISVRCVVSYQMLSFDFDIRPQQWIICIDGLGNARLMATLITQLFSDALSTTNAVTSPLHRLFCKNVHAHTLILVCLLIIVCVFSSSSLSQAYVQSRDTDRSVFFFCESKPVWI